MREALTRIESWPRNSDASITASANFSFNFLTSGWLAASTGLGPSSFFFTGGFGAPGAAAPAFWQHLLPPLPEPLLLRLARLFRRRLKEKIGGVRPHRPGPP